MPRRYELQRRGFTIVELLVTASVIGVVLAMMLPAVQRAREACRRIQCRNNLRQLGLALHNYESTDGTFPPSTIGAIGDVSGPCDQDEIEVPDNPGHCTGYASWTAMCLPMIEQPNLFSSYDADQAWCSLANRPVVRTSLDVFVCPTTPGSGRPDSHHVHGAAPTDYGAVTEVGSRVYTDVFGVPDPGLTSRLGALREHQANRTRDIQDGLSSTIMLAECAGRPMAYVRGTQMTRAQFSACTDDDVIEISGEPVIDGGAGWADPDAAFDITGVMDDGVTAYGPQLINGLNADGPYSFHIGGAQFLFADGSVHFLSEDIDAWLLVKLCTRSGGEVIGDF